MRRLVRWIGEQLRRRELWRTVRRLRALERSHGLFVYNTALAGKNGKVMVGATTVAELDEWNYNPTMDLIEKTPFLNNSKTRQATLNDSSGSFKGRHDMTDTNGQVALHNAMVAGTLVSLKLYVNATNFYSGSAFIKGKPTKFSVGGLGEVQFDFQGDGDWAFT